MKKNKALPLGAVILIALFYSTSCKKITPDVVAQPTENFQLKEQDETSLWLDNSNIADKAAFGTVKVFATGLIIPGV